MIPNACLIVIHGATSEQRDAVHEVVKEHANGWWHRLPDAWVVGGTNSTSAWRNLVQSKIAGGSATVVVFRLPDDKSERRWSYFGPNAEERCRWLHVTYSDD